MTFYLACGKKCGCILLNCRLFLPSHRRALHEPLAAAFKRSDQYQTIVCNGLSTICLNMLSFYNRAGQPVRGRVDNGPLFID